MCRVWFLCSRFFYFNLIFFFSSSRIPGTSVKHFHCPVFPASSQQLLPLLSRPPTNPTVFFFSSLPLVRLLNMIEIHTTNHTQIQSRFFRKKKQTKQTTQKVSWIAWYRWNTQIWSRTSSDAVCNWFEKWKAVNHHAGHLVDGSRGFCLWASHREPGICTHTIEKKRKNQETLALTPKRKWIGFPADLVSVTAATGGSGEGERSTESVIYFASPPPIYWTHLFPFSLVLTAHWHPEISQWPVVMWRIHTHS